MKQGNKRHLKDFFPEINEQDSLPINFSHTQFYAIDMREDNQDTSTLEDNSLHVFVKEYYTNHFEISSTLGKPISKIVQ
jgi:hypothetical protein